MSLVFNSVTIALCLLFLTGSLKNLPNVILAAILLVAIRGLFNIKGLKRLWKVNRMEFAVAMIAFVGVIILGILKGVVLAAVASLVLLLKATSNPHVAMLGRIPGTRKYTDITRHPDNEIIPGILIFRIEASLFYFNTDNIRNKMWAEIKSEKSLTCVILDLSTSPYVDIAGAELIKKLYLDLKSKGITFKLAEARAKVRDMLRIEEVEFLLGHISRKATVDDIVNEVNV